MHRSRATGRLQFPTLATVASCQIYIKNLFFLEIQKSEELEPPEHYLQKCN